jgi:hypothetical protein
MDSTVFELLQGFDLTRHLFNLSTGGAIELLVLEGFDGLVELS